MIHTFCVPFVFSTSPYNFRIYFSCFAKLSMMVILVYVALNSSIPTGQLSYIVAF